MTVLLPPRAVPRRDGTASSARHRDRRAGERGQISLLVLVLALVVVLVVVGGLAATSVHLARSRLLDVADGAALAAASSLDDAAAYSGGVTAAVPLSDAAVRSSSAAYVADRPRPTDVLSWSLAPGTGSPDGRTAVVRLTAVVRIPLVGTLLDALGSSTTMTVESRATAPTR